MIISFTTLWTWIVKISLEIETYLASINLSIHLTTSLFAPKVQFQQLIQSSIAMEQSSEVVANNSNNGVHGATFYNSSGISGSTNLSLEEYLKMALGPQKQEDEVMTISFSHFSILAINEQMWFSLAFCTTFSTFKRPKQLFQVKTNSLNNSGPVGVCDCVLSLRVPLWVAGQHLRHHCHHQEQGPPLRHELLSHLSCHCRCSYYRPR